MILQQPIQALYHMFLANNTPETFIDLIEGCISQFDTLTLENIAPQHRYLWEEWKVRLCGLDASQIHPPLPVYRHTALLRKMNILLYQLFDSDPIVLLMDTAQDTLMARALEIFLRNYNQSRDENFSPNTTWNWLKNEPESPTFETFTEQWAPSLTHEINS